MNLKKGNWFDSSSWHTTYILLVFIFTLVALYLLMPQERRFRYEFRKGRPWMHETLIAPYTFAVMKSDDVIKMERDSALNSVVPYLTYQDSVGQKQLSVLSEKIDDIFRKQKTQIIYSRVVKSSIIDVFRNIYKSGILEQAVNSYPYLDKKEKAYVVNRNIARLVPRDSIYSLKTAYTKVVAELNNLKESDKDLRLIVENLIPEEFLSANLFYDETKTEEEKKKILDNLSTTRGVVQEGERIVATGDVITQYSFSILESLKYSIESNKGDLKKYYLVVTGKMIFIAVLLLTLFLFVYNIRRNFLRSKRDITFTLIMMILMILLCRITISSESFPIYIVPFTALALIIRTFLDARLAIFVNTIAALIVGFMVPNGYEFVLLSIPAGSIAVITQNKLQRREQIILTSIAIFFTYAVTYFGISLIQEAELDLEFFSQLKWFLANAALTLITYLLVFVMEKFFGFVSDVTLIELSNSSQKLLRRLSEEAPGTNQHSLQVANLAEEAIMRLGGNPLLARAGAMYHDIGKIFQPQYFIENQALGINPHEKHSPEESADIIMEHLEKGVELARKHKIPEQIIEFIRTHHGTTKTSYFLNKNNGSKGAVDEKRFTYPGPIPSTRETAVVMLADSIEAASRSLTEKTADNFRKIIDSVFKQKIEAGQLDNAPLTLKDINLLKEVFLEKLLNIYHVRVAYPH